MWIKCRAIFKHRHGQWNYIEVPDNSTTRDILNEIYENIHTDPEGIRTPQFEKIELPPTEWIKEQIQQMKRRRLDLSREIKRFEKMEQIK